MSHKVRRPLAISSHQPYRLVSSDMKSKCSKVAKISSVTEA